MKSQYLKMPSHLRVKPLSQWIIAAWSTGLTVALVPAAPVMAQTAEATAAATQETEQKEGTVTDAANSLGAVYVTARKRAELQIDVPISMQTMSAKDMQASGTSSIHDVAGKSGFSFNSAQSTGAYGRSSGMVTFRGLQGELGRPNDSSGGVFLDGIAITAGASTMSMTDIERVEVLKGPQNAFFGRSTFGGAVNFITKNPSDVLSGSINTTINNKGSISSDATLEGPLVENLVKGRLIVANSKKSALAHASDGGELGAESSRSIGGTLYITPTDKLWFRVRGNYQKNDDSAPAVAYIPALNNTSCDGQYFTGIGRDGSTVQYTPGTPYFCGSIPKFESLQRPIDSNTTIPAAAYDAFVNNSLNDRYLDKTPFLNHVGMRSEVKQASVQMGYELPNAMEWAVNIGYNQANTTSMYDLDKTATPNFYSTQATPSSDLTLDTRLSTDQAADLRALVGVSYFKSDYVYSQLDYSPGFGVLDPVISSNFEKYNSKVPAIYGSVEYDLTDKITATAEARFQKDKITSYMRNGDYITNETSNWLPRLSLRYKPSSATSVYATASKGVQPLAVNSGFASASPAGRAMLSAMVPGLDNFTPQPTLNSFEVGFKQRVNERFQYALAIYDQKWKNRLTNTSVFNPVECGSISGTPQCPLTSAGSSFQAGNDARIRGLELSVDALLTSQWSLGGYVDYKHAKWTKFNASAQSMYGTNRALSLTGAAVQFDGNRVARVPDIQVNLNSTYRFGLSNGWKSFIRGDLTYVGRMFESDFNFVKTDPYARLDLRLGFEKDGLSFDVFVKNVTNDRSWVSVARVPNMGMTPQRNFSSQGLTAIAQEERAIGVRVGYAF